jgi:hypothetical protein
MGLGLVIGAIAAMRTTWRRATVACAAMVSSGLLFELQEWPSMLAVGLVAGAFVTSSLPGTQDALDLLHGALGTSAGATAGLWAALRLFPEALGPLPVAALTSALVGLIASQGLLVPAWSADHPRLPRRGTVRRRLPARYHPPIWRAWELYQHVGPRTPDVSTRRGVHEVALWVYRLQAARHHLRSEYQAIDLEDISQRIATCEDDDQADPFTTDRRVATLEHLTRLLTHRDTLVREERRCEALVDYAIAFLDEARAGLAVGRHLPGEVSPDHLDNVLSRLRDHAAEGPLRRQTRREMMALKPR